MGRFETQWLAAEKNFSALADPRADGSMPSMVGVRGEAIVLDMDSCVSPTHGEQEDRVWNGHYACICYIRCSCSTSSAIWYTARCVPATCTVPILKPVVTQ